MVIFTNIISVMFYSGTKVTDGLKQMVSALLKEYIVLANSLSKYQIFANYVSL